MDRSRKFNPWPIGIIIGLCLVVGVNGYIFFLAQQNPYELVTKNYYQKALRYESVIQAQEVTQRNGWKLEHSLIRKNEASRLSVSITDLGGKKINGLNGSASLFRPSNPNLDLQIDLVEVDSSLYQSASVNLIPGPWKVTFVFRDAENQIVFYKKMPLIVP